nr:hypothetical protein HK105_003284 [Polyrhizophydium stewartii]
MGSRPGPHIHPQPAAPANPQAQDAPTVPPPRAAGLPEAARVSNDSDADSTGLLDEPASDDDSALLAARRSIEPTRPSLSSLATSAISDFRGLPTGAIQAIAAAQAQQTLGQLIGALETMPAENLVLGDLPHQPLSAPQVGADAGPLSIDISDSSPSSDMPDDDVDYDGHLDDADVHAGAFDFFYSGPLNGEDTSDNLLADDASDDASQDVFHDAEDTNDGDDEWDTTSIESDDVNHNIVAHMNPSAPAESSQETPSVVQEPSHIAAASQATTQPLSSPPIDDPAAHPAFAPSIDALDFVVSTTSAPDSPPQPPPAFHKRRKFTSQASLAGDGDEDAGHDASGAGASADAAAPPPPPPSFLILHTTVDDLFLLNGDTLETECRIAKILSGWDMRREYRGLEPPLLGMTVTRHVSQVHPSLTYFRLITVTYTPEIFVYEIREQPSDLCVTAALL